VASFLKSRGFAVESDIRTRTGTAESQVVTATDPNGKKIKMRVRLCWRWEGRQNNCSAAQLRARLIDNDWNQTLEAIVSRDKSEGISHSLLLQRSNTNFVYAALIPITKLHAIWKKQSAVSAKLIADGKMGRVKKNHANI
jgi:5-methylcytosine-specific restriction protein A